MERTVFGWTLAEVATLVGGTLQGPGDLHIERPVPAGSDDPAGITFAESKGYYEQVRASLVGAVLLPPKAPDLGRPTIRVESPRAAFGAILARCDQPLGHESGIHPTAVIAATATVDPTASVGAFCVIGENVTVGAQTVLYPHSFVGDRCSIGPGSILYPRATLVQDVELGANCIIHSGAVLGADGFGYAWDGASHRKIPQVGGVRLGDHVEIGANTTVDRATCGWTEIGPGSKIDNLCQIAHNVTLGAHCVFASHVGISGSTSLGDGVVMGGQAGVADHVHIASGTQCGGRTGVTSDLEQGNYFGTPATPIMEAMRQIAAIKKLPELLRTVKMLEMEIERMSGQ